MFISTSFQGNIHEAVSWVNKSPLISPHVFQFVQQIPSVVGVIFRCPSREDAARVRAYLGQTEPKEL